VVRATGYDAFISYSHAADEQVARAIRQALHRLAKPWYRLRALRVFQDASSLSATPTLWSEIEAALTASKYFVLLASPAAADSPWVARECEHWLALGRVDRILLALTAGELVWDSEAADFDSARSSALNPALRGAFTEEPLWVDLRELGLPFPAAARLPAFQDRVADLAAPLHARSKDELIGEDVRQHRRTRRLATAAVASLTVLAMVTSVSAVVAVNRQREAIRQRDIARAQRDIATSRQLAMQAQAQSRSDPALSMLLGVAAWRTADTVEARAGMLAVDQRHRGVRAILAGHHGGANGVTFSPDGRTLATVGDDGVMLWDPGLGTAIGRIPEPAEGATDVAFTPDGRTLAIAGSEGRLVLWDLPGRAVRRRLQASGDRVIGYDSVAVRADGRLVAAGRNNGVDLWDPGTGRLVGSLPDPEGPRNVTFSPDGRLLAGGGSDGAHVWDVARRVRVDRPGGPGHVIQVAFTPDGRQLATAGEDGQVTVRNLAGSTAGSRFSVEHAALYALAVSGDGGLVAAGLNDGSIALWDAVRGVRLEVTPATHTEWVTDLAFNPKGDVLASTARDGRVILWTVRDLLPLVAHKQPVESLAFSADGRLLATGGRDGTVQLWDPVNHRHLRTVPGHGVFVTSEAFSPDGHTLLAGTSEGEVWAWDTDRWQPRRRWIRHTRQSILGLAYTADGHLFASVGEDGGVLVRDAASGRQLLTFTLPVDYSPTSGRLAFSPDGRLLAVAGTGVIALWDVHRRTRVAALRGHAGVVASVAFSPDGRLIASAGWDKNVLLWDTAGRRVDTLSGHGDVAYGVTFSPDGQLLASSGLDGRVVLWDIAHRTYLTQLGDAARPGIAEIAFSPRGRTLAVAISRQVSLLTVEEPAALAAHLCRTAGRNLSPQEWDRLLPGRPYRMLCA
jgi:WD40 repeat protein